MTSCRDGLIITVLESIHFCLTVVLPIYNKELYKIAPFPLYDTLLQLFLSVPASFFIAWINEGRPRSLEWCIPPRKILLALLFSSTCYGTMISIGNFGLFVSDVDLALLFRLSGMVWQSIFAFFVLGEKLTVIGYVSVFIVMLGVFILMAKFQWSTDKFPSFFQILVHTTNVVATALASVSLKFVMSSLSSMNKKFPFLTVLTWRYAIACIPILLMSLVAEPGAWINSVDMCTSKFFWFIILGFAIGEVFQLIGLILSKMMSVMSSAVLGQFKSLFTLVVASLFYGKTNWSVNQIIGSILLISGGAMYSISKAMCGKPKQIEIPKQTEVELLDSDEGDIRILNDDNAESLIERKNERL